MIYNEDYMKVLDLIPDGSIDLIVTDPPYKLGMTKGGGLYGNNSTDGRKRDYLEKLEDLNCTEFNPKLFLYMVKPKMKNIYIYVFCNKFLLKDYIQWAEDNKCSYDVLVMLKENPIPAYNRHYLSDIEYVVVIRSRGTYFSREKDMNLYRKWFMTKCVKKRHPAEKPLELIKRFVTVGSPEGATVFDPFMGSGTTGVACQELNRNFIGCEMDESVYEIARKRMGGGFELIK